MDNKLVNIVESIRSKEDNFRIYFENNLDNEILQFIKRLENHTSLYLFSGIIRDYFVSPNNAFRDIDLVYDTDFNIEELLLEYNFKKNSFGGYKIHIGEFIVDIWNLNETWGLRKGQLTLEFNHLYKLPDTTFFNFSSILYSLQDNEFIIGKPFLDFIKKGKIDLVLDKNPYPELCIINTIYYKEKLNRRLSKRLKRYILKISEELTSPNFLNTQMKHFDEILFSDEYIIDFVNSLKKEL